MVPPVRLLAAALALLLLPSFGGAFLLPPPQRRAAGAISRSSPPATTARHRLHQTASSPVCRAASLAELQEAAAGAGTGLLLDVSEFGLLSVTGEDRLRFLHNQLTNSFTDAQPGQVLEACYTTALGRTIDLVTVLILPEEALVLVSPNRVEQVAASMGKYIFPLDRVELTRPEGVGGVYALVGEGLGAAVLGDGVMPMPAPGRCEVLEREGRVLVWGGTGLGLPGVMVAAMGPRAAAAVVEGAAAAGERAGGLRVGGIVEWEALRIAQGRPYPDKELTSDVTPLEAGLYHTLHFDKGCYLGQETIAKVANNKGERQRLYGLRFPPESRPGLLVEGARLVDKNGARAGAVTSVLTTEGRALAYVRKTVPQPVVGAELFVEGGAAVTVVELPYATREEAQSASGLRAAKARAGVAVAAEDGADAAAAKAAEEARKAQKLEEMRKRVEAFQARQKQQQQQGSSSG